MNALNRLWIGVPLAIALVAVAILGAIYVASADDNDGPGHHHNNGRGPAIERTETAVAFRNDMRKLWEDHITWTRLFIVSFAADSPDLGPTTDRLLANQTHIGDAIKPFYGDEAGTALTDLLRAHILGAADLLAAAKAGDTAAFDAAKASWYENGDEIAAFLHGANPDNWPLEETQHHMTMHLDVTLQEAANRLSGKFAEDIADYELVHEAILEMADFLSLGIIHQFPDQFSGRAN
jgi:hypothetical protein